MEKIGLLLFLLGSQMIVAAQKPAIDSTALAEWPVINSETLSKDGAYMLYLVGQKGKFWAREGQTLWICTSDGRWQTILERVVEASFTRDSRYVVIREVGDTLLLLNLATLGRRVFTGIDSYKMPKMGNGNLVVAGLRNKGVVLLYPDTDKCDTVGTADYFDLDRSGEWLILDRKSGKEEVWQLRDVGSGWNRTFWKGSPLAKVIFEDTTGRVAFMQMDKGDATLCSIWEYGKGMDSALHWLSTGVDQRGDSMAIQSRTLDYLLKLGAITFYVKKASIGQRSKTEGDAVKICRYNDAYGSPDREDGQRGVLDFQAIAYRGSRRIITLGKEGDRIAPMLCPEGDSAWAVTASATNFKEWYRSPGQRPDIFLVNMKDGSRRCIRKMANFLWPTWSPGGKYLWWYDLGERAYYTYEINSGRVVNVSKGMPYSIGEEDWDKAGPPAVYGTGGWMEGDQGFLVYDRYDIWKLDPTGAMAPVNITQGYGRIHHVMLRLVSYNVTRDKSSPEISSGKPLVASAFDERTMANGFYSVSLDGKMAPTEKVMSKGSLYYFPSTISFVSFPSIVLKAESANVYLIRKMSGDSFPNIYTTKDFQRFNQISDLTPERAYNWPRAELIRWKTFKCRNGEAIVYKPSDFDSTKKYPVIFYCYERLTPGLNVFQEPDYSSGPMNIPWFVSRGYVVVCPDIRYEVGNPGDGIYDYVVSAVDYMKGKKWVAEDKIGLEGHSWGGYEVNYLVTRTNVFACAAAAAGMSDFCSLSGLEGFSFCSGPAFMERATNRMGGALSDSVQQYIANSPVFSANRVNTPLLMVNSDKDINVLWEQGVEFFTQLRRSGKRAWLLEYPNGTHVLHGANERDFTRRLTAFFDYYLKGQTGSDWTK